MNTSFLAVVSFAGAAFAVGAAVLPNDTFIRLLAFWSLAMSFQIVRATWRLGCKSIFSTVPSQLGFFALGLLLVNLSLVAQRLFGLAVRDFGATWMLHSDLFSGIVAAMIAGQALKYAAIDANGGGIVNCKMAIISIMRALAVGSLMFLAYAASVHLLARP